MPRHLRHSLLILCCVAAAVLGLAACGGSGQGPTGSGHRQRLLTIMEADGQLDNGPSVAGVFSTARALGVQVVRYNVLWGSYAPDAQAATEPAGFDAANPAARGYHFGGLDAIDRAAASDGITLYLTLTAPGPAWAEGSNVPHGLAGNQWKLSVNDWSQFVTAMGKRYSGHFIPAGQKLPLPRVSFWSLWNEPNFGPNLAPQSEPVSADSKKFVDTAAPQYRRLLDAGWAALADTGHTRRTDTILIGETAPAGAIDPGIDYMTPPVQFLRDLYCVSGDYEPLTKRSVTSPLGCPTNGASSSFVKDNPALFQASGWSLHPYNYTIAPNQPQQGTGSDDYADFARLSAFASHLDSATGAWGQHPRLLIDNTEYGYITNPPGVDKTAPAGTEGPVPLATAARWMNWSEYLTWTNPRLGSYDQYLLQDPATTTTGSQFYTGLDYSNGQPKPQVYAAFELPLYLPRTSASSAKSLEVWGCARTLNDNPSFPHAVAIQFAQSGGPFHTIDTVTVDGSQGCYFDTHVRFSASGQVRLLYRDPTGTEISRVQAIHVG